MIRQPAPRYSYEHIIEVCTSGITGNNILRAKVEAGKANLIQIGQNYEQLSANSQLHTMPPTDLRIADPIVAHNLTKSETSKLYSYYFINKKKSARKIYTDLLSAADETCPLCGGVGRPRNLDHFLPKSRFPQLSIFPMNLIPSCRDCNMDGKGENFATRYIDQLIHPHADKNIYFNEQWIFARFSDTPNNPRSKLTYYVDAPREWSQEDKERAHNHFKSFDIARRYAIKAAQMRRTVVKQIEMFQSHGTPNNTIQRCLIQPAIDEALFPNHWQRGLHQAFNAWLL